MSAYDFWWGLHGCPSSMFTVQFVTLQTVRAYPDPVTCGPVISTITCLPEFSCHVQSVHSEDIQSYLNPPYLASMPVPFINSTHSLLWLCCKHPDHQQWSYPPADTLPNALPFTQPSTSIDSAVISSKWINLILFYCFIIYLIWLVIILLICACILSLSSS